MDTLAITLTLAAFLTSTLSGVAGLGGGTILIGVFFASGLTVTEAVPLFAAVQLVSNSSRTLAYRRHVNWNALFWFSFSLLPATLLFATLAIEADTNWIRVILATLILISLLPRSLSVESIPDRPAFLMAGALNGGLGMLVGATGLVVGRLFLRPGWSGQTTIGTLAVTQVLGHGLRVLIFGLIGFGAFSQPTLLVSLCIAVVAGTVLGKRLNGLVPEKQFAMIFRAILVILSLKLIIDSARGFGWI